MKKTPPDRSDAMFHELQRALHLIGTLGFSMVLGIGGGFAAGWYAGAVWDMAEFGAVLGSLVGTGISLAWGWKQLLQTLEQSAKPSKPTDEAPPSSTDEPT